jgi:hypothetical protein
MRRDDRGQIRGGDLRGFGQRPAGRTVGVQPQVGQALTGGEGTQCQTFGRQLAAHDRKGAGRGALA